MTLITTEIFFFKFKIFRKFQKAHSASSLPKDSSFKTCSVVSLPHQLRSPNLAANSPAVSLRNELTLLEQIVKTHPIWYLQHLSRAATNHLLRPMEVGVTFFTL